VVKGEESTGCYHCRGCALRVWVASSIQAIKVKQEGGGVSRRIIKGAAGSLAQRGGRSRQAAIIQTRVHLGEARIGRQQRIMLGVQAYSSVGPADAVKRIAHMALVREALARAYVG